MTIAYQLSRSHFKITLIHRFTSKVLTCIWGRLVYILSLVPVYYSEGEQDTYKLEPVQSRFN